CQHHHTYPYTF
nr:immunoglobulin light chain junction region [Macaca mulatta]MOV64582.1 immunoglobulin light chain junction region [Macaca mulatta]